ncbi:GntR family transcriptional regulator [Brevibacterium sp. UCMA 11754]|uniref:GntR family transcriptional regulator n=1 Tax=Brevibacterium sp. UCMA 11754 TaxID=2749198 RepID=UPI001F2C450C|nr:GntR family transcriptional regulator [Brevibacterium sp. UCMA 11754]MCF2573338.1 GntR family transcriptional regulator [Brevibacterium sp. UCMA 11754]
MSAVELSSRLREAIMSGDLVPNQRLVEFDIAEEHGSSRGNVRIALSELTVEGLVEKVQNRGARVRAVSLEEAIEITEVRGAIEALCARRAAERIQEDQKQRLREIGARMTTAVEEGDRETYSECNRDLHSTVIEISGQQIAAQTIKRLRGQAVRFQYRLAQKPGRPAESLPQHLALIEGVCAQDPDAAASAMQAHISSVARAIRAIEASK